VDEDTCGYKEVGGVVHSLPPWDEEGVVGVHVAYAEKEVEEPHDTH
jgi:hypothetical protein